MRSIRLSLTVYFLLLMVCVLGAVSWVVYRTTEESVSEKREKSRELILARSQDDERHERQLLDDQLLQQARTLVEFVRLQNQYGKLQMDWDRWNQPANRAVQETVEVLAAGLTPSPASFPQLAFWVGEATKRGFQDPIARLYWMTVPKIQIRLRKQDPLPRIDEDVAEYFQINTLRHAFYSPSLNGRQFAFDPNVLDPNRPPVSLGWDDVKLGPDLKVRRVYILALSSSTGPFSGGGGRSRGDRDRGDRPSPPSRSEQTFTLPLYVQYACETHKLDESLDTIAQIRDEELEGVQERAETQLADLRSQLILINSAAFLTLMIGAFAVTRLGLTPLKRLSAAVSQVSEKDFHLPVKTEKMPRELTPIVERLTQTFDQLQRAFEREKQATADISHELRTPLSALMTTIDVTLRKERDADEYREALEDCRGSALQIHHAVERLLALARLDAGVDRIHTETVDAVEVARQCVAVIRPLARARDLAVSVNAEEEAMLTTDPAKLREILNNLLHNAIQYNRPNGSIEVAIRRENGQLRLQVRDTGIGIPPSAQPHIFERFFRADPSRESDGLHAGLGLAIVKGYLDLMGGTIEVDSVEGEGSTFNICLPA